VRRSRLAFVLVVALVLCTGAVRAAAGTRDSSPTPQPITITVSDGTQLACELVLPVGSPPAGGWPGLLLFPGIGLSPADWQKAEVETFAPAGFASLSCDARGTGASGGKFDLGGSNDVQDVRDLFDWFAARPDVSDTEIGAYGIGLGGGEVWNAAVAGVPFKAIVPGLTWTSLPRALTPDGVVKTNLLDYLTSHFPLSNWDPTLAQAGADLARGRATDAVEHALAARSSLGQLHTLAVPTLLIQERHDLWFDVDQATAAYKLLAGPKHLYIGPPTRALPDVLGWFEEYLAGGTALGGGVELAHAPWDGTTTSYRNVPPTRSVVVNLPGTKTVASGVLHRSVRLPGGPLETFGDGSVTVRYSGASPAWTQLVAQLTVNQPTLKGKVEPVTQGAVPIKSTSGVVTIPLMDTAVLLPRGKRLTVRLGPTIPEGVFNETPPPPGQRTITIQRVTLKLSVLRHTVSK
jgi:pimeloyl-ACP methyl ester carboxylesterase